jgi:hypothetical protein
MTLAERATQAQAEVAGMIQVYGPACEKLGSTKDTDPWRNCVLHLTAHDDSVRNQAHPSTTTCFVQ